MNELTTKWRYTGPVRYNKSNVNLTLLGNRRDLTGVKPLVEVSISYSLTGDVPGQGWCCGGYDEDERYHRHIGKTINTAWTPLHMVLCPLILSLPFHFELSGRTGQLSWWSWIFSLMDQRCHHQSSNVRRSGSHQTTMSQCPLCSLVSPLLSVFLGLHGHLSLSLSLSLCGQ